MFCSVVILVAAKLGRGLATEVNIEPSQVLGPTVIQAMIRPRCSMVHFMADDSNSSQDPALSRRNALIIAAARAIIAESGVEAVTRRRIAMRAGLTSIEVVQSFHSRAALMRALRAAGEL